MRCCLAEEKCMTDMREAKRYHRRHKVCEVHAKAQVVLVGGSNHLSAAEITSNEGNASLSYIPLKTHHLDHIFVPAYSNIICNKI